LRPPETLAEVLRLVEADPDLGPTRRRDLASALRAVARIARRDLAAVPAGFAHLRALTAPHTAAALGLSAKRWANVRAELAFALASRRRRPAPPPARRPPARAVAGACARPCATRRSSAASPASWAYCADRGVAPEAVDEATFAGFRAWLEEGTLVPDPAACTAAPASSGTGRWRWSGLAAADGRGALPHQPRPPAAPDLPGLVPRRRRGLARPPRRRGPARRGRARPPLRPASLRHMRYEAYMVASAWARAGGDPAELRGLADLVEPGRFRPAMRFLLGRYGGKPNRTLDQLATTFAHLARHWVGLDPGAPRGLVEIRRRLRCPVRGLTEKNRARLRQFDEPLNQLALLELPDRLLALAGRQPRPAKGRPPGPDRARRPAAADGPGPARQPAHAAPRAAPRPPDRPRAAGRRRPGAAGDPGRGDQEPRAARPAAPGRAGPAARPLPRPPPQHLLPPGAADGAAARPPPPTRAGCSRAGTPRCPSTR
jgi:hypothetical protein